MNHLVPAQAGAQLITLLVFIALARWYVAPWLTKRQRADALIALLWVARGGAELGDSAGIVTPSP